MEIKNKPTLAEKQAFWAEQLPNFESKYWLPSHFELLEFDMEGGNYEVRDVLPEHYSEDDATEIWHRVNTGWAMWKKAINFTKAQVPESNALLSAAMDAIQKLGSGDFVLVPKDIISVLEELAQFSSYAEIVGGISVNRAAIREQCDIAFTLIREFEDTESLKEIEAQEQSHD